MLRGSFRSRSLALAVGLGTSLVVAGAGCNARDRLTFPSDGVGSDHTGPTSTIDAPSADTTVSPTPNVPVSGRVVDADGIDTVYFETVGGLSSFQPFSGGGTSVRCSLPITADARLPGRTITIRVFGTDRLGNRGDTAIRRITV